MTDIHWPNHIYHICALNNNRIYVYCFLDTTVFKIETIEVSVDSQAGELTGSRGMNTFTSQETTFEQMSQISVKSVNAQFRPTEFTEWLP